MGVLNELRQRPGKEEAALEIFEFWWTKYEDGVLKKWGIEYREFLKLLVNLGFSKLTMGNHKLIVRINNSNWLSLVERADIADVVFDYLDQLPDIVDQHSLRRTMLEEFMLRSIGSYFKEERLVRIKPKTPLALLEDTPDTKYFPFKNGIVKITAKRKELIPYSAAPAYVWEREILRREFQFNLSYKGVFYQFMEKVCGGDMEKINNLMIIAGYLLHFDKTGKRKAVVFTDSQSSEDGNARGRTGKSLFSQGLAYALSNDPGIDRVVVDIHGKDFNDRDKHKYQDADINTRLIILNDVRRNFKVEPIFPDVTEGIKIEYKGERAFRVIVKIIINTNSMPIIEEDSSQDRFLEFSFTNYFSAKHSPEDEFGHWFFRDWNPTEWARFDALMVECVHRWLKAGRLPKVDLAELRLRKLVEHTKIEFVEFMEDVITKFAPYNDRLLDSQYYYDKKDLFLKFKSANEDYSKLTMNTFHKWIVRYTTYHDDLEPFNKPRDQYRNNGFTYICFRKKDNKEKK